VVSHCNMEIVSVLLDTDVCDVNTPNRAGYTAVMLAALADIQTDRQLNVVMRLFESGNVDVKAVQVSLDVFTFSDWLIIGSHCSCFFSLHIRSVSDLYFFTVLLYYGKIDVLRNNGYVSMDVIL